MQDEAAILHFDRFALDRANRRLTRGGHEVEIGSRYFDALTLLVEARGALVSKDRFMDEVWRGVPVTDEALTQCIRTLRRALDDDAASPRFIATVPKHGYRFVGSLEGQAEPDAPPAMPAHRSAGRIAAASTIGGALAGVFGGLLYGLLLSSQDEGAGSALFLAMVALCLAVGVLGGAGVGIGMALATALRGTSTATLTLGGGIGGIVVGALGRLVGVDLFEVLAGVGVGPVTGLLEGGVVGMLAGGACALTLRYRGWKGAALAALLGASGGALLALAGGRLMAGSLLLLDHTVADSRLRIDGLGALLGEPQFGQASLTTSSALEAAVFVTCVALALQRTR
ncbi:winged helix-turn-helix domain-containing protein [Aurantiacibacter hainanensis]|uniref:winged helix-turn-helix domain-containing protein n=1 Tax=Aurantiacibacter hainanensis TaxID=3076114 RepID=UPI0030C76A04